MDGQLVAQCTAVVASYCTVHPSRKNNAHTVVSVPRLSLLSISPMGVDSSNGFENALQETTRFSVDAYAEFFCNTIEVFKSDFDMYFVARIGDNVGSNKRVSDIAGKPSAGCSSHELNLKVRQMIEMHIDLKSVLTLVHDTMREVSSILKSADLTDLGPICNNKTHRFEKVTVLKRFTQMREDQVKGSENTDENIVVSMAPPFARRTGVYHQLLSEIDVITQSLQK